MIARLFTVGMTLLALGCGPNAGVEADAGPGPADADPFRPDAAEPARNAAVYAHSAAALYRVDPDTLAVTPIADFVWPGAIVDSMTDIAIDKDGTMIGISFARVYSVNKETAEATFLADLTGAQFNGLSFVPGVGPDPNAPERLVGATQAGDVFQIDPATGASNLIGNYGGGWGSSGDIVSVRGFGTVATVSDANGTDRLARLDPDTFAATIIGDTAFDSIWGVGFWEDRVFGFTDTQKFILIDTTTGAGTEVEASGVNWWGAAVTTSAPVVL